MTQETKHTPGKWRHGNQDKSVIYDENGFGIAVVSQVGDLRECEANAHLIAAAPDLLARLEVLEGWISDHVQQTTTGYALELADTRAVIAKAKGGEA